MLYIQIQNLTIENESLKTLIYSVREVNEILKREAQLNLEKHKMNIPNKHLSN